MTATIKKRFATIDDFRNAIANISEAYSIRDNVPYTDITIAGEKIIGHRKTTDKPFEINLTELFEAQQNLDLITTSDLKSFITTRAQSPAMAILKQLNII